jgi:hypothetical protein
MADHRSGVLIAGSATTRILVKKSTEEIKKSLYTNFDTQGQILARLSESQRDPTTSVSR